MMKYTGIGPEHGNEIEEADAFEYALNRCLNGPDKEEFRIMLVEWFFSGNWIRSGSENYREDQG